MTARRTAIGILTGVAVVAIGGGIVAQTHRPTPSAPAPSVQPVARPPARTIAPKSTPTPTPTPTPVAAEQPYTVKRILQIPEPFRYGQFYWDEAGVPAGEMVITVDVGAQTISVFRGGYEIGTAVVVYGADEKPTPLGIFRITEKDADHVSNLYDAPMPYMLRLTNDGISIHGSPVALGKVTHGCVGVPTAFAKKLFGAVKVGDKVIVTHGERLDLGHAIKAA